MSKIKYLSGDSFTDERGKIRFTNEFNLLNVKRFYTIEHANTQVIRAWQGHEVETKYFSVLKGKFVVAWVEIDNFDNPSENLKAEYIVMDGDNPAVLHIPPGFGNGLRALEANSIIAVFSDYEIEKSIETRRRYNSNNWLDWFQNFEGE